jgi:bacteriocin-like protein
MARNQTNTLQARELTEAELDAVSGGDTQKQADHGQTASIP